MKEYCARWDDATTHGDGDSVPCPYCKREIVGLSDYECYGDEQSTEVDCRFCERTFQLTSWLRRSYSAAPEVPKPEPRFPQEVCPRGEFGECAFAWRGVGLGCTECGHYVHPGESPKLEQYYSELKESEVGR